MSNDISLELLNKMALSDGEHAFLDIKPEDHDSMDLEAPASPVVIEDNEIENLFAFTKALRDRIGIQETNPAAQHRLEALVHNFQIPDAESTAPDSNAQNARSFMSFHWLRESLSGIGGFPIGGAAVASAFAVFLFVNQEADPNSWESRYAEYETGAITEAFSVTANSDYFQRPPVTIRGKETELYMENCLADSRPESESDCVGATVASQKSDTMRLKVQRAIDDAIFEPVLRATERQGLLAARIPEQNLWLLIRATIDAPERKADDSESSCKLVEVIFSASDIPPADSEGIFLSYCPQKWTEKLSLL